MASLIRPRKLLGADPSDRALVLGVIALLFAYYLLTMAGHHTSSAGFVMFQNARVLVTEHTFFFTPELRWGDTLYKTSQFGPGPTFIYVPILFVLKLVRPELFTLHFQDPSIPYNRLLLENDLYLMASWVTPLIVANLWGVLYALARERGLSPRWSVACALVCGIASPIAVYARSDTAQMPMALLLTLSIWLVLVGLRRNISWVWLGAGLVAGFGILTRFESIIGLPWLVLLAVLLPASDWQLNLRRHLRGLSIMGTPVLLAIILYLWINTVKFGSPLNFGYPGMFSQSHALTGLVGTLFSPGKGIFWFFPLSVLGVLGFVQWVSLRDRIGMVLIGLVLAFLVFYSAWDAWWGGWSWGPRQIEILVPLVTLASVEWASKRQLQTSPSRRVAFAALAALSWLITINGLLFNFLDFYSRFYAKYPINEGSAEHFWLVSSPILFGWNWSRSYQAYDLFWLDKIFESTRGGAFVAVALLVLLLFGAAYWLWLNLTPDRRGASTTSHAQLGVP